MYPSFSQRSENLGSLFFVQGVTERDKLIFKKLSIYSNVSGYSCIFIFDWESVLEINLHMVFERK